MTTLPKYLELDVQVVPRDPWSDLLIAELGATGFESFTETTAGFRAYVNLVEYRPEEVELIWKEYNSSCSIAFSLKEIQSINWNEEWESNFDPVIIEDRCMIYAPFHDQEKQVETAIVIHPKMAFGTGHHQTTYLMIQKMLDLSFKDQDVLDMGCGTAVLSIFAAIRGARKVLAIDIDEWAYQNSLENIALNPVTQIIVKKGDVSLLEGRTFNIILANINKNVLLSDLNLYVKALAGNGHLLISGFLQEDVGDLDRLAEKLGLVKVDTLQREHWCLNHYRI